MNDKQKKTITLHMIPHPGCKSPIVKFLGGGGVGGKLLAAGSFGWGPLGTGSGGGGLS